MQSVKKRFWTQTDVSEADGGFTIELDGRGIRTPARCSLLVPTRALADVIAAEWDALGAEIDPDALPYTKLANAATDKVAVQFDEVVEMLAAYGETDLLCHRAESPEGLVARQTAAWDPVLDWVRATHGWRFEVVAGVLPGAHPDESIHGLREWLRGQSPFALMGLHDLITISGSILLARAVDAGQLSADAAWTASRIDEHWQAEKWGRDSEAEAAEAIKQADFLRAARLLDLLREA